MILAIATPTAQAANLVKGKPILIMAVTDPVGAGLVENAERQGANVTGTNYLQPMEEQFKLAQDLVTCQYQGFTDVGMGIGMIVIGLASEIIWMNMRLPLILIRPSRLLKLLTKSLNTIN